MRFALLALTLGACAPVTLGAQAIQPSAAVDTPDAWIYLRTNDDEKTGVYRCYEGAHKPVCIKAQLMR